jgi:predicted Zn-dependent protease
VPTREELERAVEAALRYVSSQPGVREAEVFAASNRALFARLNYTSHIPSNGVEEAKSAESWGLGIQVVLDGAEGLRVGFGSEPSDLGLTGAERALQKARRAAVHDPEFHSLPRPPAGAAPVQAARGRDVDELDDVGLVRAGWTVLAGGLRAFLGSAPLIELAGGEAGLRALGLILGGDVSILHERAAIASTAMPRAQSDESTLASSVITAMVESRAAKGSGWALGSRLDHLAEEPGADAAHGAVLAMDGERVPTGDYTVIFGKQPVADLMNNLVLPSCQAGAFYSANTPFLGKLGRPVSAPGLSVYDHGALPGFAGTKAITCEGLPTGRTDLIKDGVLVGLLTNWYDAQRLLHDPDLAGKVGVDRAGAARALVARNGFRFDGLGRSFEIPPGIAASNVIIEHARPTAIDDMIRSVAHGLYIGRIWYTYPINGLRAGDFTGTVVGDSFVIRDGRRAAPIKANTLRINDNIVRVLEHVVAATKEAKATAVWAADEVVYAPEIAVSGVHVDAIASSMEDPV